MKTPWKKTFAVAAVVCAGPASAIPVTFDFSGTVSHVFVFDFAAGVRTVDLSTAGQTFSAQFTIDTDLFTPHVSTISESVDLLTFRSELPGAVNSTLMINGESIDFAPYSSNRANAGFYDSNGVVSCGEGCSRLTPDQFNASVLSEELTPLGLVASRELGFAFVADSQIVDNPESAMSWFDFSPGFDLTQLASLPLPDFLRAHVQLNDSLFECTELRCQQTASHRTLFNLTSVGRTVASVPEPGALGLLAIGLAGAWFTRRRPARSV